MDVFHGRIICRSLALNEREGSGAPFHLTSLDLTVELVSELIGLAPAGHHVAERCRAVATPIPSGP